MPLFIYEVSRHVRHGGDELVVVARDEEAAQALAADVGGREKDYSARKIGVALEGQEEGVVLSSRWHA